MCRRLTAWDGHQRLYGVPEQPQVVVHEIPVPPPGHEVVALLQRGIYDMRGAREQIGAEHRSALGSIRQIQGDMSDPSQSGRTARYPDHRGALQSGEVPGC
jgi:hypothetical protein